MINENRKTGVRLQFLTKYSRNYSLTPVSKRGDCLSNAGLQVR